MFSASIDVVPKGPEAWQVRFPDGTYLWRTYVDKAEAIARAKELAMNSAACMVVRGLDGEVQSQRDFGMRGLAYVS